jgi:hypothetical protein
MTKVALSGAGGNIGQVLRPAWGVSANTRSYWNDARPARLGNH